MRCRARAMPSTTGSTASRWLGLAASRIFTCAPERKSCARAITEVILHIAVPRDEFGNIVLAEFGEDYLERFLEEIREHVESAAVRHAHANFLDPVARARCRIVSRITISDSAPWSEKRFCPT